MLSCLPMLNPLLCIYSYLHVVHDKCANLLHRLPDSNPVPAMLTYLLLYAAAHESWHVEDLLATRQFNRYPFVELPPAPATGTILGDVAPPGRRC